MKFTDLAFLPLCRMNEVCRYSSVYQETNEKLSDHIVDVMMMSYILANKLSSDYGEDLDIGLLLEKCLIHDIDEVITGDIPRNTKYATDACHKELNIVAEKAIKLIESDTGLILEDIWSSAKEGKEGLLLSITDMFSVVKKCITEIELRGNYTFLKVVVELEAHLKDIIHYIGENETYNEDASKFLIDIISDAYVEIKRIHSKYKDYMTKYHIRENIIERK